MNNGQHYNDYALQLDHGVRDLSTVEREIVAALPPGTTYDFHVNSAVAAEVNRSLEPESISLGVFGLIAGLAALIIVGGVHRSRSAARRRRHRGASRARGQSRRCRPIASAIGPLAVRLVGIALAVDVAFVLSPLSPIGPVRAVYPDGGFAFDGPVLGFGVLLLLLLVLSAITFGLILRRSRRVVTPRRCGSSAPLGSRAGRLASDVGLPVTAVVGIRFALEPPVDRDAAPVRSALVGAMLAVMIVVATLTFGSQFEHARDPSRRSTGGTGTTR